LIKLLPIVVFALLLIFYAPLSVYASTGQETVEEDMRGRFCDANPDHVDCTQEWEDQSDGDGIVGGVDDEDNVGEERENKDDDDGGPNPYCDTDEGKAASTCHDRKDYSETTGLYSCNDGTQKTDWRDCEDATDKGDTETGSIRRAWYDTCYASGYKAGQNGPFSRETYDHCGDEDNGDDAYYNGFINGCIEVDNTRDVCIFATDA